MLATQLFGNLPTDLADLWGAVNNESQLKTLTTGRIEMMLRAIFLNRAKTQQELMVRSARDSGRLPPGMFNNLKTKNDKLELIEDVAGKWNNTELPPLVKLVEDIKHNSDPKKKRELIERLQLISPMQALNNWMSAYDPSDPSDDEEEPEKRSKGYLRRMIEGGGTAAGLAVMNHFSRGALTGGLIRGAAALFGLHKWAKGKLSDSQGARAVMASSRLGGNGGFGRAGLLSTAMGKFGGRMGDIKSAFTSRPSSASSGGSNVRSRVAGAFKSLGMGGDPAASQGDFTPKEETKENDDDRKHMIGVLEKIEENTRGMAVDAPKGDDDQGGLAGLIKGLMAGRGLAMLAGLIPALLGAALPLLAAGAGAAVVAKLVDLFKTADINNPGLNPVANAGKMGEKFANWANDVTGHNTKVERRRAANKGEELEGRQKEIATFLKNEMGLDEEHVAAIMGNMQAESNFDPSVIAKGTENDKDGGAFGLIQYRGARKANLFKFAKDKGLDVNDTKTQLMFMKHESENDTYERSKFKDFKDASGVDGATKAYALNVERFQSGMTPEAIEKEVAKRSGYAQGMYSGVVNNNPDFKKPSMGAFDGKKANNLAATYQGIIDTHTKAMEKGTDVEKAAHQNVVNLYTKKLKELNGSGRVEVESVTIEKQIKVLEAQRDSEKDKGRKAEIQTAIDKLKSHSVTPVQAVPNKETAAPGVTAAKGTSTNVAPNAPNLTPKSGGIVPAKKEDSKGNTLINAPTTNNNVTQSTGGDNSIGVRSEDNSFNKMLNNRGQSYVPQ